jgi:hypothetical protein
MEDIEKVKTKALEDIEKAREIAADELEKAKEKAAEELEKARLRQLASKLPRIRYTILHQNIKFSYNEIQRNLMHLSFRLRRQF